MHFEPLVLVVWGLKIQFFNRIFFGNRSMCVQVLGLGSSQNLRHELDCPKLCGLHR
ncbi:MAG: hypothetical protein CM15mP83_5950 [Flavobacteriaceae bacterium]|nr:MAG: hypothetical protein CM15mP83_5950 [Flavobacteriaceae bacterium]